MGDVPKYKVKFPQMQIRITEDKLTFAINKIKSRTLSVVYFKFYGYDLRDNVIVEHTSDKWVITSTYQRNYETFDLEFETNPLTNAPYDVEDLDTFTIELYTLGITSENPLWFNHLQLTNGEDTNEYHVPNEERSNVSIGFARNSYVNLYDSTDTYLQIIRPNHEGFTTENLTHSQRTILVPHLPNESEFDNPTALLYEYMYMTEQRIGVEK